MLFGLLFEQPTLMLAVKADAEGKKKKKKEVVFTHRADGMDVLWVVQAAGPVQLLA